MPPSPTTHASSRKGGGGWWMVIGGWSMGKRTVDTVGTVRASKQHPAPAAQVERRWILASLVCRAVLLRARAFGVCCKSSWPGLLVVQVSFPLLGLEKEESMWNPLSVSGRAVTSVVGDWDCVVAPDGEWNGSLRLHWCISGIECM